MHPCTDVFSLGQPTLADTALNGTSGKASVVIPVTLVNLAAAPQYGDINGFFNECYGLPPGGWAQGQTVNSGYEANLERWDSGWRLAQEQPR